MKRFLTATSALILLAGSAVTASAQNYDRHDNRPAVPHGAMNGPGNHNNNDRFDNHAHANWHKGGRIERNDWNRGQRVDYRTHHLSRPQRGYEWRQVDGNYVLAAAATGLIASIILSSH